MCCLYNLTTSNISSHLTIVGKTTSSHHNLLIIRDPNSEINEMAMSEFCETYNLQNIVKIHITKTLPNPPVLI